MFGNYLDGEFGNTGAVSVFPNLDTHKPAIPERSREGRRKYRTIWISDVHLGTKGCNADADRFSRQHRQRDDVPRRRHHRRLAAEEEVLLAAAHNDIVWRILKRAKRGTRIVYIPGNHDEMFRQFTGLNFGGVEIRRAAFHDTADGRRLMVLHGDEFDAVMLSHRWLAFVGDAPTTS